MTERNDQTKARRTRLRDHGQKREDHVRPHHVAKWYLEQTVHSVQVCNCAKVVIELLGRSLFLDGGQ